MGRPSSNGGAPSAEKALDSFADTAPPGFTQQQENTQGMEAEQGDWRRAPAEEEAEAEARNAMQRTAEEDADGALRRPPKDEEADMRVRTTQLHFLTHPLFSFHVSLHYSFFSPSVRRTLSVDIHRDGLNRRERSIFAVYVLTGGSWRSSDNDRMGR